jgi:RNA polymerase sigma-54 factor
LLSQLSLTNLEARDRNIVAVLIEALDEDGYMTQLLEELVDLLPAELEIELDELQIALRHLQNLDPTGIGARDCAECLELQLLALPDTTPARSLALTVVRKHLQLLATRDFAKLRKTLQCSEDELRQAQHLIQSLNPRPGAAFTHLETRYVVPDVVVKKVKGVWVASLNPDAVPKLRINRMYADILQSNRNNSGGQLSQQLQEARWLIKNVQQRFETILRVSQAIVDRQRHFFEHGEVAMRPLVLREIADTLGLHESTVSRVTTQKFMLTPRGIFELKYFFGSHVATETGGACSATAIRALIKQLVAAEDAKKPLSDSKIAEILGQQGIVVARRTIAKYRESLHIPPVNLRKSL